MVGAAMAISNVCAVLLLLLMLLSAVLEVIFVHANKQISIFYH